MLVRINNNNQDPVPKKRQPPKRSYDDIEKDINTNLPIYDKSARSFLNNYISSSLYRQRLIKQGYANPDAVIKARLSNLKDTTPKILWGEGTAYLHGSKNVEIDPTTFHSDPNSKLKNVIGHEYSHASGARNPDGSLFSMNENDFNAIRKRNKLINMKPDYLVAHFKKIYPNIDSKIIDNHKREFYEHDSSIDESKADIDALRYMLYEDKIYDAGKGKFNKEILDKAKKKYSDTQSKRLFNNFSDNDIIWMMNNIATNKSSNNNSIA